MIESFSVKNYRAFARKQTIKCKPLTLFFGRNSSGKSALVRFLPLLAESIVANQPIWLGGKVGRKASWRDLVCKANEKNTLSFELHWADESLRFAQWDIGSDLEGFERQVERLEFSYVFDDDSDVTPKADQWLGKFENTGNWPGLLPLDSRGDKQAAVVLAALQKQCNQLCADVQWVSGIRAQPERFLNFDPGMVGALEVDGSNALAHLIAARAESLTAPLLTHVQDFFTAQGEQLLFQNIANQLWRVMLAPTTNLDVAVDLCDTGEGYAQVLPILVALARARTGGPRVLCLEQPELHLHTRAQAELAKILVATANDPARPQLLVETHSEVLLTSVQLAIAEGRIEPSMVRVYWVAARGDGSSEAMPVDFDAQGRPNNAKLTKAFDDISRLGRELMEAQMAKFQQGRSQ